MNQVNVKVSFYMEKSEADAGGNCPVMAKLNIGMRIVSSHHSGNIRMSVVICLFS